MDRITEFSFWAEENPVYGYRVDKSICYDSIETDYALKLKEELKIGRAHV